MTDSTVTTISFSKFNKNFQEKLCLIILDDRNFADRMMEVMDVNYLELRYLQVFVQKIFDYKQKYGTHPSREIMQTILRSNLDDINETLQKQVRDYYARLAKDISVLDSVEYIKDEALDFCRKQKLYEAMTKAAQQLKRSNFDQISTIIGDAMKLGADNDFGYDYMVDFEERYSDVERFSISTGWNKFDELLNGGHGRGELGVVIAPTGVGKSMVLVHLGAAALKQGYNVVHYTLELKAPIVANRYDSCFTGITLNELADHKQEVFDHIKDLPGKLKIREYPTKQATVNTIRAHLAKLKQQGFEPDVVLIDYGDLLKPVIRGNEKRHDLEEIYEELRAIMTEYNCAGWTASQTNRTGLNQEVITMEAIAEAYNKCFPADFIFSVSRTIEDKTNNGGRVFVAKNRNGGDGMVLPIFMDPATVDIKILEAQSNMPPVGGVDKEEMHRRLAKKYAKFNEKVSKNGNSQ